MPADVVRRLRREITVRTLAGDEWSTLARGASDAVKRCVPFQKACWHPIDPVTHLLTGALKVGFDRDEPRLPRYEATVDDVNKFAFLARSTRPVGILSTATHGNLNASARYRDLLAPLGIAWEMRAVFTVDGTPWGACSLYRVPGEPDFSAADATVLSAVTRTLGEAFRRALLLRGQEVDVEPGGPGVVILDEDDNTVAQTDAARQWLADLVDVGVKGDRRLPAPVYAVAARARAIPSGNSDPASQARARAFTRSGRWLLLYAARLSGDRDKLTSVVIEPAKPADVALLLLSAYGLSERECDIAQLVFAGRSTSRIAESLHISPLTVQHYLKTVFEKAGVHSRRELVARLGWRDGVL